MSNRALAALLLVIQAALSLLAALGLHAYVQLSRAFVPMLLPDLLAFAGPLVLTLLAVASMRGSRRATIGVFIWEALTMLGAAVSLLASRGTGPLLTLALTGLALPAAVVLCLTRPEMRRTHLTIGLLLATACIHLALAPVHISENPALGRLFLLDGLAFVVVAYLGARDIFGWRPLAGALLTATILAYLVVVLRRQEDVDDLGIATKFVELVALGLVLWPAGATNVRLPWLLAGAGLVGAILTSGGLAWAATLRAPAAGHTHAHVLGATPLTVDAAPTDAEKTAAAQLVADTRSGIARFGDLDAALADGYRPATPAKAPTVHYLNPKYARSGRVDPQHPQELVYASTPNGPLLLGAMFMLANARQQPPDIGGSLTEWHRHDNLCFLLPTLSIDGIQTPFGTCPLGSVNAPTPAMLHVWIVPNPAGPFADLTPAYQARLIRGDA